jgi:hypothetical protein
MWLFTSFGFFSIFRKTDGPDLTIRSRTRGDIQRLRCHYLPQASEPEAHTGTDYPWRMRCGETELAQALPRIVAAIGYANFKDEMTLATGKSRAKRYGQVWSALYGLEEDLPEPEATGWQGLPWPVKNPVGKPRAFSGVLVEPQGRLLLPEVAGHFGGYVWSFAKAGLRWALPDEARHLIAQTTDTTSRERDRAVLQAALAAVPSPLPLQRPIARRENWRTRPLPALRTTLPYRAAGHLMRAPSWCKLMQCEDRSSN